MSQFLRDYLLVFIFSVAALALCGLMLGIGKVLQPRRPSVPKQTAHVSGVAPVPGGWSQSQIRYYIFALLFVMFDVEAVFIFPWAIRLEPLAVFGLIEMTVFILVLLLGLVYAWRKRVL